MRMRSIFVLSLLMSHSVLAQSKPVTYERDVRTILEKKCLVCHSGSVKRAGLDLSSHESALRGGESGVVVVPGDVEKSLLVALASRSKAPVMPPKGKPALTADELALLKRWIADGAQRGEAPAEVSKPSQESKIVRALALAKDGSLLVAGRGRRIHLYALPSGKRVRSLEREKAEPAHESLVESIALSPDGQHLASGGYRRVRLWDVSSGKLLRTWTGFADRISALAFSPDGQQLVATGGRPTEAGEAKLFRVGDGKEILSLDSIHSDTIFGVRFRHDGKMLATCGADGKIVITSLPDGKRVKTLQGHTHHVLDVAWRADGKLLASAGADKKVRLWDFETGEELKKINRGGGRVNLISIPHESEVNRVVFIGDKAELLTCSGAKPAQRWSLAINPRPGNYTAPYVQPKLRQSYDNAKDYLFALAVSEDGNVVAVAGESGTIRVFSGTKEIKRMTLGK